MHVAKRILVSQTQALMQAGRVEGGEWTGGLADVAGRVQNFRARISLSGPVSFDAGTDEEWRRAGTNDDLTLALAIALWTGENPRGSRAQRRMLIAFSGLPR